MKKTKKLIGSYFSTYIILVMVCLVTSVVIISRVFAEDKSTIRSIIIRGGSRDANSPGEGASVELLKKYKDIGINYVTVYAAAVWSWAEKEPGKYDFTLLGATLNNVKTVGLKAIVRLGAEFAPEWVWTYGKKDQKDIFSKDYKVNLDKVSVYPVMGPDGRAVYTYTIVDPWDATGNYLKLKYIAAACHYLQKNYADVVEYVDVGMLTEGIWCLIATDITGRFVTVTPTWAPTALDSYRRYLQEIYMDVADVNKIYKTNWKSFWEATPPRTYEDTKYFWDWYKWYERGMVAVYMREAAVVRRAGFKVSILAHFVGTASNTNPPRPNLGYTLCSFLSPYRMELIDADLYIIAGGFGNITWHDEITYDPYGKNPLVLVHYPGVEVMNKIKKERPNTMFIIEDWEPDPILAEYIGLSASVIDGFQLMQGTFSNLSHHPKDRKIGGRTPEEMFEELKDAINTFFIWKEKK